MPDRYEIGGYEVIERTVRPGNQCSARLNLPLSWQGLRVKVVRIDPLEDTYDFLYNSLIEKAVREKRRGED